MDEGGVCTRRREKEKEIKTATTTTTMTSGDEGIPVGISVKYPGIDKARTRSHPSKLLYPSFSCSPRIFYPPRILTSVPSATTNKGSAFSSAKMMRARSNHLPLPPDSTSPTALPPSILHVSREPPSPSLLRPLSSQLAPFVEATLFRRSFTAISLPPRAFLPDTQPSTPSRVSLSEHLQISSRYQQPPPPFLRASPSKDCLLSSFRSVFSLLLLSFASFRILGTVIRVSIRGAESSTKESMILPRESATSRWNFAWNPVHSSSSRSSRFPG